MLLYIYTVVQLYVQSVSERRYVALLILVPVEGSHAYLHFLRSTLYACVVGMHSTYNVVLVVTGEA